MLLFFWISLAGRDHPWMCPSLWLVHLPQVLWWCVHSAHRGERGMHDASTPFLLIYFFLTFCIFMAMVTVNNRQTMSCQDGKQLMLSPDMFGWPCHRPRNYCVCTLDATCRLKGAGFSSIRALFRSSALNVSALFCASQDTSDWLFVGSVCIYIYINI